MNRESPALHTTVADEKARIELVERAATIFLNDPSKATVGTLEPGSFLALRWGLLDRGILVVRLADEPSVLFNDAVVQR